MKALSVLDHPPSDYKTAPKINLTLAGKLIAQWRKNPNQLARVTVPFNPVIFGIELTDFTANFVREFGAAINMSGAVELGFIVRQEGPKISAKIFTIIPHTGTDGRTGFEDEVEITFPGEIRPSKEMPAASRSNFLKMIKSPFQTVIDAICVLNIGENVFLADAPIDGFSRAERRRRQRENLPMTYKVLKIAGASEASRGG